MSSAGQAIGGVVGAVVGFFTPLGPVYGAQIGMMIGGVLDPPRTEGPRLEDLTAQTSVYGAFIPRLYGTTAVTGNVIWIQGDKLIERSVESDGKGGPVVTNFEYFATFAVGLCEGPIDGVRRIWIGGQLWYDAGSDDLATIIASNEVAGNFTLYTGTDTQLADPLIQADRGTANVPAYRGLAYIVFEALPLKDYGNSLVGAQVKVEVCAAANTGGLVFKQQQDLPVATTWGNFWNAPYRDEMGTRVWGVSDDWGSSSTAQVTQYLFPDVGDPILLSSAIIDLKVVNSYRDHYVGQGKSDKNIFVIGDFTPGAGGVILVSEGWGVTYIKTPGGGDATGTEFSYVIHGNYVYFTGGGIGSNFKITRAGLDGSNPINLTLPWLPSQAAYYLGILGNSLVTTLVKASDAQLHILEFSLNDLSVTYDATFASTGLPDANNFDCEGENVIFASAEGILKTRVGLTGADSTIGDVSTTSPTHVWRAGVPHMPWNAWIGASVLRVWVSQSYASGGYQTAAQGTWTFNKLDSSIVQLGDIIQAECLKSDLLTAGDLDITELTDQVRGYRISSLAPLRGGIDQLRKAWPFDAIQHGYKIKFKKRGGASVATITEGELDAREAGANPGVRISNVREMDLILPQQLTVQYMDAVREYDVNVAEESR